MNFWDASAIVPLLVAERATGSMRALYRRSRTMLVWWGTTLECGSAISRCEREGLLRRADAARAMRELEAMTLEWHEVAPGEQVRATALRLLRTHPLRATDALQLAAALVSAEMQQSSRVLVTLDARLADAGQREGFAIEPEEILDQA